MNKTEDEIVEDGELTSDYESENLAIYSQNYDRSADSQSINSSILDKSLKKNSDFQNLLTNFEKKINTKNANLTENNLIEKISSKYFDNDKSPIEEEDEMIFVRGASPAAVPSLFSGGSSLYTKEMSCEDEDVVQVCCKKQHKVKKHRKSKNHSKKRDTKFKRECNEKSQTEENINSSTKELKICKFYLLDKCGKSEKTCTFLHSQFPCKYYYLGLNCPNGDSCKLNHGGLLSDEMKAALLLHIQIAPREILGNFRISSEHAKKLLNDRLMELASQNVTELENNISPDQIKENSNCSKNMKVLSMQPSEFTLPDSLKIEELNDIFNQKQIESLKKIGVLFSFQLLALSMLELNACKINVMQIVKIQEKIKERDNIKLLVADITESNTDVDMRNVCEIANSFSTCVKENSFKQLLPPVISTDFHNSDIEDFDEECDLVIDEEAFSTSDGEVEFLKHGSENNEMSNIKKQNSQKFYDHNEIMDLSKNSAILCENFHKSSENLLAYNKLEASNKLENKENNNEILKIGSCDLPPIEINNYGDFDMRLPFNPALQNYKPATEYDGSFKPNSLIPWKLVEIMLPTKQPIPLELVEKLQQSNDPRFKKQRIHQEMYSFDGTTHSSDKEFPTHNNFHINYRDINNNENNNKILNKKEFLDPRKNYTSNSTYENLKHHLPTAMQILQHYLHRSRWYNEQNSKVKMEINELIANLANFLENFKQDNTPHKIFHLDELKCHNKIQNILNNLQIIIDSHGSIFPKNDSEMNYFVRNRGIAANNLFRGFETFRDPFQPAQQPLPVISNLVPIGSFQAPVPLHFTKPGLLGLHPNDTANIGFNNSFRIATAAIHTNNMHFGNNTFYGDQNLTLSFSNYRAPFSQASDISNSDFKIIKTSSEKNFNKNRNNFKSRNNAKLSNWYSNNKKKKITGLFNNFENKQEFDNYLIKENINNNDNFESGGNFNECGVIRQPQKEKLQSENMSENENWDDDHDEHLNKLDNEKETVQHGSSVQSSKSFENNEENWDTDDGSESFSKLSSKNKIKLGECDVLLEDSAGKCFCNIADDFEISPKKQKFGNTFGFINEANEKSSYSSKRTYSNSLLTSDEIKVFEDRREVTNNTNEENKNFELYPENNIEISKTITADDSEEDWD